MNPRRLVAIAAVLVATTANGSTASPAEEARAAGPTGVHTTMTLLASGAHRVTATGHARAGARVYLQDRFDEHELFATQKAGRTSGRGTFRLTTKTDRTDGTYRVCVVDPGKDACTRSTTPRVVQRHGTVTLTTKACFW